MFKAEFELEAITPIFMRGADQTKAEIRAPSIKGLMRWWFRALAGNYFGNDVVNLRKAEEEIFGSTKRRSKVVVEISNVVGKRSSVKNRKSPSNQLRYLWFSINLLARKNQFDEYYPEGTKFQLKIKALDERSFKIALASLWALVTLGGIGFRSRRGAGSVRVRRVIDVHPERLKYEVSELFDYYSWRQIEDAAKFWDSSFKQLRDQFNVAEDTVDVKIFKYPSYPSTGELIILECSEHFDTYIDALLKLEQAYAGELKGSGKHSRYAGGVRFEFADKNFSHTIIERFKQNSELEKNTTERRFYFGLPLIYANWKTEVNGYNEINLRNPFRRRGSSIILTVKKDSEKYVPIVVILPYQFLPNHEGRFVAVKRNRKLVFQLITNNDWFVEWLKKNVVKEFEKRGFVKVYPKG